MVVVGLAPRIKLQRPAVPTTTAGLFVYMKYSDYLQTDYWKAVTVRVKERAGYRCQLCNSQHDLCAHHRTSDHRGRELEFLDDLTCLCRRCHEIFHGIEKPAVKRHANKERRDSAADAFSRQLPSGKTVVLTKNIIEMCRKNSAFTSATINALGVTDLSKGWVNRLVGKTITREALKAALDGRTKCGERLNKPTP